MHAEAAPAALRLHGVELRGLSQTSRPGLVRRLGVTPGRVGRPPVNAGLTTHGLP